LTCDHCGGPLESLAADCEICQALARVQVLIKQRNSAYREKKINEWEATKAQTNLPANKLGDG
jgi:hypothetical protein